MMEMSVELFLGFTSKSRRRLRGQGTYTLPPSHTRKRGRLETLSSSKDFSSSSMLGGVYYLFSARTHQLDIGSLSRAILIITGW